METLFKDIRYGIRGLGRTFLPEEDKAPGASPVAVISHSLWQRRFSGDLNVIGKSLVLNGHDFTIVGVAPKSFVGTEEAFPRDIWIHDARANEGGLH